MSKRLTCLISCSALLVSACQPLEGDEALEGAGSGDTAVSTVEGAACTIPSFPKGSTWIWDLENTSLPTNLNAQVYVVDLYGTTSTTIQAYKNAGKKVVCYFSAGSFENWRDDADDFPQDTYCSPGENCNESIHIMGDWCDSSDSCEWWLDHRKQAVRDVMAARIQLAKTKGCDAVEPDNVDAYSHDDEISCTDQACWGITAADQLAYNRWLADTAHANCLGIALKNDVGQVTQLAPYFDFAINEECQRYKECGVYKTSFVAQNKAVFNAEYRVDGGGDTMNWTSCTTASTYTCACGESNFASGDMRTLVFKTANVRYNNVGITCW